MTSSRPLSFEISKTECFIVKSHKPNKGGYPRIWINGILTFCHRHIWQECFGPVPSHLRILHRCDNPACINPNHLFLGTQLENMQDRDSKKRQPRGEKQGHAILKEKDIQEIRQRCKFRHKENSCCAMARQFGVSDTTIRDVIHRRTWGWLD